MESGQLIRYLLMALLLPFTSTHTVATPGSCISRSQAANRTSPGCPRMWDWDQVTVCWSLNQRYCCVVISLLQWPEKGRQPVCIRRERQECSYAFNNPGLDPSWALQMENMSEEDLMKQKGTQTLDKIPHLLSPSNYTTTTTSFSSSFLNSY